MSWLRFSLLNQTLSRGIATYMICVEAFTTENQVIKALFESQPRDQGHLQTATIKGPRMHSCNLNIKNQMIKSFRRDNQAVKHISLPIINLDSYISVTTHCFSILQPQLLSVCDCGADTESDWCCGTKESGL